MIGLLCFVLAVRASPFKSKLRLEAENAVLRHQLIVLRRRLHGRVRLTNHDRWFLIQLYRWFPAILQGSHHHPAGAARALAPGRLSPLLALEVASTGRATTDRHGGCVWMIRRMSIENPLWGAPRIHGELLKLGFEIAQPSVAKYMVKRRGPPSQGWRTFCVVTRQTLPPWTCSLSRPLASTCSSATSSCGWTVESWPGSTSQPHPTAEWVARQITEAFPWDMKPRVT